MPTHQAAGPGLYLLTYGEAKIEAGGKQERIGPGTIFARNADDLLELSNPTDRSCQMLLFELLEVEVEGSSMIPSE